MIARQADAAERCPFVARCNPQRIAQAGSSGFTAPPAIRANMITAGGITLPYTTSDNTLPAVSRKAPVRATPRTVPGYTAAVVKAGKALADQYDTYKPFTDLSINGKLTLGENIADVAGLAAAYDAYRASLRARQNPTTSVMAQVYTAARNAPKRVIFAEAENEIVLRAAIQYRDFGYGEPVLVGRTDQVKAKLAA